MRPGKARKPLPIVGIGASAGGIEAFRGFFENMPPDSGLGFVVVLHLPPDRKSVLPDILGRWTSMPVVEAVEGGVVQANHVYVPPPGIGVALRENRLHLHRPAPDEPREFSPISMFFDSLAASLREDAIGVVLSGTGSDGALGLKAIKEHGGLTLAQGHDGNGPRHDGMPASAIATGAVDIVATAEAMPGHILAVQEARRRPGAGDVPSGQTDAARREICAVLNRQLGHDFTGYKDKTFLRRVQRRMHVLRLTGFEDFIARLRRDPHEVVMLFRELLIGVTSFFRDGDTFEMLQRTVIPRLFEDKGPEATIRVWVPGCATGEEAYSLAILLCEHAGSLKEASPKLQVFATDIDDAAISTARTGRYPSTLLQGMSPDRLARFFVESSDGSFTVGKSVRELCTFSAHSLVRDPPFSRIDLISCRNLLIYLDTDLQATVIPAFHYSLVANGLLLLGSSETITRHEGLFTTIDRHHRIFQKLDVAAPPLHLTGNTVAPDMLPGKRRPDRPGTARGAGARIKDWASSRILERYAPAFVVVTANGDSVRYSSRIGKFLELAPGLPSQNVLAMARRGLRAELRMALAQAVETGRTVERSAVPVSAPDGTARHITLVVEPRREQNAEVLYLIVFIQAEPESKGDGRVDRAPMQVEAGSDPQLEVELRDTREQLQSVTEEHETALEELRSANEELHSVNEELQSTNEELETSKEEIQSINEELQTVNNQLAGKVDELDRRNSDLRNLFESTQVATIFLDPYLIIRSFTPAVASIYNLIPSDQGRPLSDIVNRLRYTRLREDCHHVLQTLEPLERRVAREDGSTHYLMRILPYRSPDSTVDGTIVTFVDVSSIVQAEQHQRLLVDELNHRVKNMLTVVISLATQTMRRSDTMQEFFESYMGRIHALTAAYSLLSNENWQTVAVRDLLMEELKPFLAADQANLSLEGPRVLLEPRGALALGMAIHELTTNAVKYGALSVTEGRLKVIWHVESGDDGSRIILEWIETDGPAVRAPARKGFGMALIERGLRQDMSAQVEIEFASQGVRARLRAPLGGDAATRPGAALHDE